MRYVLRPVSLAVLALFVLAGCASTATHRSTGETIDDASITAAVKTKLAEEKVSTLTKIDVDTNRGTVTLNGTVDDEAMKVRAGSIARQVKGVNQVVNNLKVKS
jgi:hyperosmotically inducible protein